MTKQEIFLSKLAKFNPNIEIMSNYKGARKHIKVKCIKCGYIWETIAGGLLGRHSCPKCAIENNKQKVKEKYSKLFVEKAKQIHNNFYDYSKANYINAKTKVVIICPIHGEFEQTPDAHLKGQRCPKCAGKMVSNTQEFIEQARKIHGNEYNYSKVNYTKSNKKVCIICPKHGEFWQTPNHHLDGMGCPNCKRSQGETLITTFLNNHNIYFISQYKIPINKEINSSGFANVDFYVPLYNTIIEFNGIQHFIPIERFGGEIAFQKQIKRDSEVKQYCINTNTKLLIIEERTHHIHKERVLNELNLWLSEATQLI